jgi:hypothetical protein
MNLNSPTIGTNSEICLARESLPEPSHTKRHCMFVRLPHKRLEFVKVVVMECGVMFDAWASRTDGKVYL